MKNIDIDIKNYKKWLIRKANKNEVWENFGQIEVNLLENKYQKQEYMNDGIWQKIRYFDYWCMNYTGIKNGTL